MSDPSSCFLSDRMLRGDVFEPNCPARAVLQHMTSKWGVLTLIALRSGTHRFSDLRRKIGGVSERMLAQTLKTLEADHLLIRRSFPVVPPHVEYTLTDLGSEAATYIEELTNWIENNVKQLSDTNKIYNK